MPQLLIAVSILVLILGAGAAAGTTTLLRHRPWYRFVPIAAVALAGVATLLLRWVPPGSLQISAWLTLPPTPIPLALAADRLNLPFAWLLLAWLVADELDGLVHDTDSTAEAADRPRRMASAEARRLLAAAAGLTFLLANNLLTLCLAWVGFDIALWLAQRYTSGQREPVPLRWMGLNLGAILAAVAAAALPGHDAGLAVWSVGDFPDVARGFLALAAAILAGAFPFQPALSPLLPSTEGGAGSRRPWALGMLPLLSGLYLLLRTESMGHARLTPGNGWLLLGGLGLLATGVLSHVDQERRLLWIGLHPVSLLLLLVGLDDPLATVAALLVAINVPLSVGLLALTDLHPRSLYPTARGGRWAWQAMRWLAVGSLLGVPPTLGFAGRWAAYRVLLEGNNAGVWLIIVALATVPMTAALLDSEDRRQSAGSNTSSSLPAAYCLLPAACLAVPLLILSLQPLLLGSLAAAVAGGAARLTLAGTLRATPAGTGFWIVITLLVPLAAGYGLIQPGMKQRIAASRLSSLLATALALDWAYDLVGHAGQRVGAAVTVVLTPLRGERYVSWTLLLAVILVLLLVSR
jgi:hypothetical protein